MKGLAVPSQCIAALMLLGTNCYVPPSVAQAVESPNLSAQQVAQLAAAELQRKRMHLAKYLAEAPQYRPVEKRWLVHFSQVGPVQVPDGDIIVVVNDVTQRVCSGSMFVPECT